MVHFSSTGQRYGEGVSAVSHDAEGDKEEHDRTDDRAGRSERPQEEEKAKEANKYRGSLAEQKAA
jgi:hypothetical protein